MLAALRRDIELDLTLESEARTTLILVGVLLAFLVLVAGIVFSRHSISRFCRRVFFSERQDSNMADMKGKGKEKATQAEPPILPVATIAIMPVSYPGPLRQDRPSPIYQLPSFFNPIRKHSSTPRYASINLYRGNKGLHTPPAARFGPTARLPMSSHDAPSKQPVASPHIVGWMAVADAVVGAHPHARPLHARVATKAEIDLISGHVHIPWAFKVDNRPPPVPVKVQRPDVVFPVLPPRPPPPSGALRDVGNIRGRSALDAAADNMQSVSSRKTSKAKYTYRTRGKENLPVTSLPPSSARGRF